MRSTFILLILAASLGAQTKIDIDSQTRGVLSRDRGGTGETTAQAAIDALVPAQSGKRWNVLGTDGTNVSWSLPIPTSTIASPPASPTAGLVVVFTDAASSTDCTTGGGGSKSLCRYSGSVYESIGGAAAGLGDPGGNGMVARTALNTTAARTVTGTSNEISVTNGDGVSGNPTLALASTFDISGKTSTKPMKTGTTLPGTCAVGEYFMDTDAAVGQNTYACTSTNTWTLQGDGGGGGSGLTVENNGSSVGTESTLNLISGTCISWSISDAGSKINATAAVDTAVCLTKAALQSGSGLYVAPASGSGTTYTASMTPALTAYTAGMTLWLKPDVANTGATTLNLDSLGAKAVKDASGTALSGGELAAGRMYPIWYDGTDFRIVTTGGGGGGGMSDPGANGVMVRTALNTTTARTVTGTSNEITVTNGDGVSGNPTLAIASTFDVSGKTSTKGSKTGTSAPGTCSVGETFIDTDAPASQQWLLCTATNTWTTQGGSTTFLDSAAPRKIRWIEDFSGNTALTGGFYANGSATVGEAVAGMVGAVKMTGASGGGDTNISGGSRVYRYGDDSTVYPMTWFAVVKTPATLDTRFGLAIRHDGSGPTTKQTQAFLEMDVTTESDTTWHFRYYGSTLGTADVTVDTGVTVSANTVYLIGFKLTDGSNGTWYVRPAGSALSSGAISGSMPFGGSWRLIPSVFVVGAAGADRILYVDKVGMSNE